MQTEEQKAAACPVQSGEFRTMIGGQALIEGILMRGPKKQAAVVRTRDGSLEVQEKDLHPIRERYPILGVPLIRGCVNFLDSIICGTKALMWSAEFFPEDDAQPGRFERFVERHFGSGATMKFVTTLAVVMGLGLSIVLFVFLPTLLTGGVLYFAPDAPLWLRNLLEGVVKVIIFLLYLRLSSLLKDIQRTFAYHGAEHQCIYCYEQRLPLTVENVRKQTRFHPRCGTSFLFVVIILSILLSSVVFVLPPVLHLATNTLWRIVVHLILLPVVVSLTYELNRLIGRHDNAFTRVLTAPGLWLQRLTTAPPDDSMIEVAIAAMRLVLPQEEGEDAW